MVIARGEQETVDAVLSALANPTRREILERLIHGESTVQGIAERFDMARPSVSEHLRVLREAGLVVDERRGRHRCYRLTPEPLLMLQSWLHPYERFWRDRLLDLGTVLDETSAESDGL